MVLHLLRNYFFINFIRFENERVFHREFFEVFEASGSSLVAGAHVDFEEEEVFVGF